MPIQLADTMSWRDQPVLVHIVGRFDEQGGFFDARYRPIAAILALEAKQVRAAMHALADAGMITGQWYAAGMTVKGVSGPGRQLAGSWPSPENMGPRFIEALNRLVDQMEPGPDHTKLQLFADAAGNVGGAILGAVIQAALTPSPS